MHGSTSSQWVGTAMFQASPIRPPMFGRDSLDNGSHHNFRLTQFFPTGPQPLNSAFASKRLQPLLPVEDGSLTT